MKLNREQEDALLRFDPTEIVVFMLAGKPEPRLMQQLKRRGLCYRWVNRRVGVAEWSISDLGQRTLMALRRKRGLPDYPKVWGVDEPTSPPPVDGASPL